MSSPKAAYHGTAPWPYTALQNTHSITIPQTIAHRGNDRRYPENSLEAVKGAIAAGCHAVEIDLRVSRDGVVVLAHDRTLQRCFGVKEAVNDCDWAYLRTLETTREPKSCIPLLSEVLEYLAQPELEHIWILLDIKFNNPTSIVRRTAAVLSSVQPSKPWNTRLTVGLWSASFLPFSREYLPDLPVVLISPSIRYARQFLSVPNIAFSVNQKLLMGPLGRGFLDEARARERAVYVWTVNEHNLINWCLRAGVDGIITDAVETCREKAEDWDGKEQEAIRLGQRVRVWIWSLVFVLLGWILEWKYLTPVKRVQS